MSAAHVPPGTTARALLGGDDAVHVFDSHRKANAYESRMPGARTLAPNPRRKAGGWGGLLAELRELPPRQVRDRHVVIELDPEANAALKSLIRSLGALFYRTGAIKVTCWGRTISAPAQQTFF
jgi:hypothetical protein